MTTLDLPLRSPALYNPHLLSKEELLGLFSARQALLEELVKDLESTPRGEPAQHHLIVGQRGMGKTMLLRRLYYAVDDSPTLKEHWLALSFPEEQYNVATLSDFWLNCVDALSDAIESRGKAQAVQELDRAVEELRAVGEESERARRALDLLTGTSEKLGKRLLLLVDNADLVLARIGGEDEAWALREVLSSRPAVTFVGASSAALESAYEYGKAFYEFFRIHDLAGLSEKETRNLLLRYADQQGDDQVRKLLERDPGRLRTLHTLTGGNPRTLVLLFNIFAQGADGDVRADLERLLDQCTPLYKARFEALSPQAQQLVDALALHWDPVSAGELAKASRLSVNTASAQLNRLVREGVVEKVPYEPASKTGFQLAERFFNIWYLMRASRRVRRRLIWLVEFLRMFYGEEELRETARRHIRLAGKLTPEDRVRHAELSFALAFAFEDEGVRCVLERSGLQMLVGDGDLRSNLRELVDLEAAEPELKTRAEYLERFETLQRSLDGLVGSGVLDKDLELDQLILRAPLNLGEKEQLVEELRGADAERIEEIANTFARREKGFFERLASDETVERLRAALHEGHMKAFDDVDGARLAEEAMGTSGIVAVAAATRLDVSESSEALEALEANVEQSTSPYPWLLWLERCGRNASPEEVDHAVQRTSALAAGAPKSLSELAFHLNVSLNRLEEAEALYRRAIELDPEWESLWIDLGNVLDRAQRLAEAVHAYRKAIELNPQDAGAWNNLGNVLEKQGLTSEAEEALRKAVELDHQFSPWAFLNLADLLQRQERFAEAEGALKAAIEGQPGLPPQLLSLAWLYLGTLLEKADRQDEAEAAYRKATKSEPASFEAWPKLALLLARQVRTSEESTALLEMLNIDSSDAGVKNAVAWSLFESGHALDEAGSLARNAVESEPSPEASHTLACILVRQGKWNRAIAPAMTFLSAWASDIPDGLWPDIVTFFRETVAAGKTAEAAELLDELELGERWRPLREALEALARENRNYLRRVAPEVRKPAEVILEELTAPREGAVEAVQEPAEKAPRDTPTPVKKRSKKRRTKP